MSVSGLMHHPFWTPWLTSKGRCLLDDLLSVPHLGEFDGGHLLRIVPVVEEVLLRLGDHPDMMSAKLSDYVTSSLLSTFGTDLYY